MNKLDKTLLLVYEEMEKFISEPIKYLDEVNTNIEKKVTETKKDIEVDDGFILINEF
jgi:hypothetical protein